MSVITISQSVFEVYCEQEKEIEGLNERIKELEAGSCRFHCRTRKAADAEIERLGAALKVIKRFPFPATEVRKTATQALLDEEIIDRIWATRRAK